MEKRIDTLRNFIRHELAGDPNLTIARDEDLLLSGLVDSLGVMRLAAFIDETFGIAVPPVDVTLENFGTLQQMDTYLATRTVATT